MGLFVLQHTVQQGVDVTKQLVGRRRPELSLEGKQWEEEDALRSRLSPPGFSLPGFIFVTVKLRICIFDHHDGSSSKAAPQFPRVYTSSLYDFLPAAQQHTDTQGQNVATRVQLHWPQQNCCTKHPVKRSSDLSFFLASLHLPIPAADHLHQLSLMRAEGSWGNYIPETKLQSGNRGEFGSQHAAVLQEELVASLI